MKRHFTILFWVAALLGGGCASEPAKVRTQPVVTYQVRPMYPVELATARITGEVVVDFVVDAEGIPVRLFVLRSTRKEFEAPALAAVAKWRFKPGTLDGKPVPTHMAVPIVFEMDKK
jgi:periplasmic protein TonB